MLGVWRSGLNPIAKLVSTTYHHARIALAEIDCRAEEVAALPEARQDHVAGEQAREASIGSQADHCSGDTALAPIERQSREQAEYAGSLAGVTEREGQGETDEWVAKRWRETEDNNTA